MKYCSQCGTEYEDRLQRCPQDGGELVPTAGKNGDARAKATEMLSLEETREETEKTSEMAREIEDLILKVCSHCHSAYGAGVDVCPEDGTRLVEPSVLARQSLFVGEDVNTALFELKKYCPSCSLHFELHVDECDRCGKPLAIPTLGGRPHGEDRFAAPDSVIADKYRILNTIDSGGFGCVHLAKHESLGKRFAIKVLRGQLSDTKEFRNRFHEEALKLSRLEDEHVVKVFDFGECEDSQYMVTEYVDGRDLGVIIYEEKISPVRAAKIMRQVAGALAEAHSKKIVHLDLKPRNILVTQKRGQDIVKVIDFGIAEIYSETGPSRQETVAGTCTYMAPEQWRRQPLDPRTDIYSFGVIFYEVLAGRPPFRQTKVSEIERAHLKSTPPPLRKLRPDVPVELEKLVQQCMEKKREKRIQSAEELEARLESYVKRSENVLRRWVRRSATPVVVASLLTAVIAVVWNAQLDKEPPMITFGVNDPAGLVVLEFRTTTEARYVTRARRVRVTFEATDNRKVRELFVRPQFSEPRRYSAQAANIDFDLELGRNRVTAWAEDESGNVSDVISLTFFLRENPALKHNLDTMPPHTNVGSVTVAIDELTGVRARLVCRRESAEKPDFEKEIEEAGSVDVPLEPGTNVVEISGTDLLTGEEWPGGTSRRVVYDASRLSITAEIEVVQDGTIRQGDEWLTSASQVVVLVHVPDADRLPKDARIGYRVDQGDRSEKRFGDGESRIEVKLTEDGAHEILVEAIQDIYGNESDPIPLTVVRDTSAPELTIDTPAVVEYFRAQFPRVRFTCSDEHPAVSAFSLVDSVGKEVNSASFKFVSTGGEGWHLEFLNASAFPTDRRHDFKIRARDRVRNTASAGFSILVDQTPPEIVVDSIVVAGVEEDRIRRGEEVTFAVRVEDTFPERVEVKVEVRVEWPDGPRTREFPMTRDPQDEELWTLTLRVAKDGIEKPGKFLREDPHFGVTFRATDSAGRSDSTEENVDFAWENGDRLFRRDIDSNLVYHDAGRTDEVDVEAFFIEELEVSNRQYARFLAEERGKWPLPYDFDKDTGRPIRGRENWPVRGVTPRAAEAYAAWADLDLARREQWLVAAFWNYDQRRKRRFPWGREPVTPLPVCGGRKNPVDVDDSGGRFTGGRTPSPFRLVHMFGNVWEIAVQDDGKKRLYYRMGGGFTTPLQLFTQESSEEYLRGGRTSDQERFDLGFRCTRGVAP